jgi:hypothetical protein
MTFRLDDGTVVSVAYDRGGEVVRITCVVIGLQERFVHLLPVTPATAPTIDTLIDVMLGDKLFRATVQESTNNVFTVMRPLDIVSGTLVS